MTIFARFTCRKTDDIVSILIAAVGQPSKKSVSTNGRKCDLAM